VTTPHRLINSGSLEPPVGFSHAVAAAAGRLVCLGGQVGHDADGRVVGADLVQQFDRAAANVVEALAAAGGRPEHIVSMQVFTTDAETYRSSLAELGRAWRSHLGRHYPALSLFEVRELFDPEAKVELVAVAVVPGDDSATGG
jgi:enamine deaminase RidA (YjgF/YER057c/UK114 family)